MCRNNMCENENENQATNHVIVSNERKSEQRDEDEEMKTHSKWTFLQHNGPLFPSPYEPLPHRIPFKYKNRIIKLSPDAEEAATFYANITKKELLQDDIFNKNFFTDWKKAMTEEEKLIITDLKQCNFRHVRNYLKHKRKYGDATEQKKKEIKERNARVKDHYGFCTIDKVRHEIANYKINTGIFIGRGKHPKIGRINPKIQPEDVTINCSEDSQIPEAPVGHSWKKIVHDNTSTWLAKWNNNILNKDKYVQLKTSSKLKIEDDQNKYEKARELNKKIVEIRRHYCEDMYSENMEIKQRAVALYFIDNFGCRTGNEKNKKEEADTVGCCSLRVEHITLQEGHIIVFNFLGKSSIRYYNEIPVEEEVFKNLQLFQQNKSPQDKLFDLLTPPHLNRYLNTQMENLTARVFRTYNASYIFEKFLLLFTDTDPSNYIDEKIRFHKCANFVVALLLNHRTACERQFEEKKEEIVKVKKDIHGIVTQMKRGEHLGEEDPKIRRLLHDLKGLLFKNKEILPGTSKFNYLDPRIAVAWCKIYGVPIERIYTRSEEMKKFGWAITMQDECYRFSDEIWALEKK